MALIQRGSFEDFSVRVAAPARAGTRVPWGRHCALPGSDRHGWLGHKDHAVGIGSRRAPVWEDNERGCKYHQGQ